jgi:hypothetical protein
VGHHKRRRPKNQRAGCLMCKPWKQNGLKGSREHAGHPSDLKRIRAAEDKVDEWKRGQDD